MFVLLLTVSLFSGAMFLMLQTQPVKDYITERTENWFNEQYEGTLQIGDIGGILPLRMDIRDVELSHNNTTLISFKRLNASVDVITLLRNQLTVNDITVENPRLFLSHTESGQLTLSEAFQRKRPESQEILEVAQPFRLYDIFAPLVRIVNGSLIIENWPEHKNPQALSHISHIDSLNADLFLELSQGQRYLDITHLSMKLEDFDSREFTLSGQLYNDSEYLELNAIQVQFGNSNIAFDSEFTGINLFEDELGEQFRAAPYHVAIRSAYLASEEINSITPALPDGLSGLHFAFNGEGQGASLHLTDAEFRMGESLLNLEAVLDDVFIMDRFTYDLDVQELRLGQNELQLFVPEINNLPFQEWSRLVLNGHFEGGNEAMTAGFEIDLPEGSITADGRLDLKHPYAAQMNIIGADIRFNGWQEFGLPPANINTEMLLTGDRLLQTDREIDLYIDLFDSQIGEVVIPDLQMDLVYSEQIFRHEFTYYQQDNHVTGRGRVDLRDDIPHFLLTGNASDLNLKDVFTGNTLPETAWNMNYDINWHGVTPDTWYGRFIVDVIPSLINGNEVRSHQVYLDLNHPDNQERSLRFTSSILDFLMEGNINFTNMFSLYHHWESYFTHRVKDELMLYSLDTLAITESDIEEHFQVDVLLEIKDISLLKTYLPGFPDIETSSRMELAIDANRDSLGVDAEWVDQSTKWNGIAVAQSDISLSAGFRFDRHFRNYSRFHLDIRADHLMYHDQEIDEISWLLTVTDDAIYSQARIENFGNRVRFSTEIEGKMTEFMIQSEINEFILGNDRYLWVSDGNPRINYDRNGRLRINELNLVSGLDHIFIDGVFGPSEEDSVIYRFANVDLSRISQIIDGKLGIEGVLNGDFITKSLADLPVFQGQVSVDQMAFDGRPIGNVNLASSYDPENNRFDTEFKVKNETADQEQDSDHRQGSSQDLLVSGWFKTPSLENPIDSLFYFDVDAQEVDAWVLMYLLDSIFESIEGSVTGTGHFTGNLDHVTFDSRFEVIDAEVTPIFFETEYLLNGDVSVSREEGVQLHDLQIRDNYGGTGVMSGTYDFNDFQTEKNMNLSLRLNNLSFLNNSDGPEVPFHGTVAGTGLINISGTNISPYVRTLEPIYTTSQSRLSVPLMDQVIGEEQGRFIRFVSDFSDADMRRQVLDDPEILRQVDRSFMEVFRLDLQFIAPRNFTMQLIFDPVTGEIVNAQGGGRVRITLEDETLQIFGNYNIDGGDYLFVGGDILTRRFTLRDGGSIRWDGDPSNALLDITAVYRARPNIAPLLGAAADQTNRIPVELMLEITGPLDNIENDFYFEFPNAIDATQNAAVLNVLNSEEQKLIQATSLLFTGGFISGTMVGDTQTQELGSTLQARAGQVGISQLLSSQINALLSDNLINLDVDLNLFGFDQADLGIALRLFDDRLVLRREGEVGGEETNIGDLGATYRINPNLSVEVFHRKDPMLMSILGAQAEVENVNGVGLEAQFRFNTWREFSSSIWRNVSTVFGLFGRDETEPEAVDSGQETDDGVASVED